MPRGSKTCPGCQEITGPRAWNCPKCGHGYTLRGTTKPDVDVTAKQAGSTPNEDVKSRLWNLVEPCTDPLESATRKEYHMEGRTWDSKCGKYRIREQLTFRGVRMEDHYSKCVHLFKRRREQWESVRPKGRFKTPLAALRMMVLDTNKSNEERKGVYA